MYRFSRAIYREIASGIVEDEYACSCHANHERVLRFRIRRGGGAPCMAISGWGS